VCFSLARAFPHLISPQPDSTREIPANLLSKLIIMISFDINNTLSLHIESLPSPFNMALESLAVSVFVFLRPLRPPRS
jgi:hypothetical protein